MRRQFQHGWDRVLFRPDMNRSKARLVADELQIACGRAFHRCDIVVAQLDAVDRVLEIDSDVFTADQADVV